MSVDIFLYAPAAIRTDILLSDPTVVIPPVTPVAAVIMGQGLLLSHHRNLLVRALD